MPVKRAFYRVLSGLVFLCAGVFAGCDGMFGLLGGADQTDTLKPGDADFRAVLENMDGIWYSHYAGIGRTDGYRIGQWNDFDRLVEKPKKGSLFPGIAKKTYKGQDPTDGDYFVFYDDTVYGQKDDESGGNGGWGGLVTRYIGIVRAVNIFNGDIGRGAIIIEYLQSCAPTWDAEVAAGKRPFFGIYYRVLGRDTVQMANAVDLAALYAGERYSTETATLDEAVNLNTVENEAEFISWGVVIPQDREPDK
jgi:hypothetical protein